MSIPATLPKQCKGWILQAIMCLIPMPACSASTYEMTSSRNSGRNPRESRLFFECALVKTGGR